MGKKNKDWHKEKISELPREILASDTMRCGNCNSIIGCFAGPPPVCPVCGKSPVEVFSIFKYFRKNR